MKSLRSLLITIFIATGCLSASAAAPSDVDLLEFKDVKSLNTFLRFSKVSNTEGGIRIDYELSPKWPSAEFLAPKGYAWNLSSKAAVEVTLTNLSSRPERFFIAIGNPSENRSQSKTLSSGRIDIQAGETKSVQILISNKDGFDPSLVSFLRVFTGMHESAFSAKLSRFVATGSGNHTAPVERTTSPATQNTGTSSLLPAADGSLLDLNHFSELQIECRFATATATDDGVRMEYEVSPKWPSVEFLADAGGKTWDLSGYTFVEATITNTGDNTERVMTFLSNPGQTGKKRVTCSSGRVDLSPGETQAIRITLSTKDGFNPADVSAYRVFTGKHSNPVKLKLTSLKAIH